MPVDVRPPVLSTAIHADDPAASLDLALRTAELYGLNGKEARMIASEVAIAVARWRDVARGFGAARRDIDRMASAFEHDDADAARRLSA